MDTQRDDFEEVGSSGLFVPRDQHHQHGDGFKDMRPGELRWAKVIKNIHPLCKVPYGIRCKLCGVREPEEFVHRETALRAATEHERRCTAGHAVPPARHLITRTVLGPR